MRRHRSYALGRAAVVANLYAARVANSTTGREDAALTAQFRAPYMDERWAKWAQHFCTAACHRDAQYAAFVYFTLAFVAAS